MGNNTEKLIEKYRQQSLKEQKKDLYHKLVLTIALNKKNLNSLLEKLNDYQIENKYQNPQKFKSGIQTLQNNTALLYQKTEQLYSIPQKIYESFEDNDKATYYNKDSYYYKNFYDEAKPFISYYNWLPASYHNNFLKIAKISIENYCLNHLAAKLNKQDEIIDELEKKVNLINKINEKVNRSRLLALSILDEIEYFELSLNKDDFSSEILLDQHIKILEINLAQFEKIEDSIRSLNNFFDQNKKHSLLTDSYSEANKNTNSTSNLYFSSFSNESLEAIANLFEKQEFPENLSHDETLAKWVKGLTKSWFLKTVGVNLKNTNLRKEKSLKTFFQAVEEVFSNKQIDDMDSWYDIVKKQKDYISQSSYKSLYFGTNINRLKKHTHQYKLQRMTCSHSEKKTYKASFSISIISIGHYPLGDFIKSSIKLKSTDKIFIRDLTKVTNHMNKDQSGSLRIKTGSNSTPLTRQSLNDLSFIPAKCRYKSVIDKIEVSVKSQDNTTNDYAFYIQTEKPNDITQRH